MSRPAETAIPTLDEMTPVAEEGKEEVVNYPAEFFTRYRPNTALDMVMEVPGFRLDNGSDIRGFGGASGNILIDGRRTSAKQTGPSAILARIPASYVERIELIRGIEQQGEAVVANIILKSDVPGAFRWEVSTWYNDSVAPWMWGLSLSLSDRWSGVDYNTGINLRRATTGKEGVDQVFNGDGDLVEERFNDSTTTNLFGEVLTLNAETAVGENLVGLNLQLGYGNRDELFPSRRIPVDPDVVTRNETFGDARTNRNIEIGTDVERRLTDDLVGKLIVLFYQSDLETRADQRTVLDTGERILFQVAESDTSASEAILRLETNWNGWKGHAPRFNMEGTFNSLNASLVRTKDTGSGPVVVNVPGANTLVEEKRGDLLLNDTWTLGDWILDYGLGAEVSEISQTGDAEQTRSFLFIKPQGLVTWSPSRNQQTRLRLTREVAQLDFKDFVSSTVFLDDDLSLGNPDLKPQSTWLVELQHERRFGDIGVVKLTGFHHWIRDVQDLLPITDEFEVPGNIGDGRFWGLILAGTLPLEWSGLTGGRLDLFIRWHDSSVTDPVTGRDRILSRKTESGPTPNIGVFLENTDHYGLGLDYRQDFQAARVAWGWDMTWRTERSRFKVNELDVFDEGIELNTFIETTRWWGLRIRFRVDNVLDVSETRDRTLFTGRRNFAFTGVDRREISSWIKGRRYVLSLSGSF